MKKVIAVKIEGKTTFLAMKKVLDLIPFEAEAEVYEDYKQLIQDIIDEKIIGVIGVGMDFHVKEGRTEGVIRHDLKYFPGFDYDRANAYPLPPIVDKGIPILLADIIKTAEKMYAGILEKEEEVAEEFDFEAALPELVGLMKAPRGPNLVAIVDDKPQEVEGLLKMLEVWPELNVVPFVGPTTRTAEDMAKILYDINPTIILLDEDIDQVKGTEIALNLNNVGYQGIVATITGGEKPDYANYHFALKAQVMKKKKAALEFVDFINKLL